MMFDWLKWAPSVAPEDPTKNPIVSHKLDLPCINQQRLLTAQLDGSRLHELIYVAYRIMGNMGRYRQVGEQFDIPWWVIGAIHCRESAFDFTTWLCNGDPLSQITTHVPKGLGPVGCWEEGALASLGHVSWGKGMQWDLPSALAHLEAYNGLGYVRRQTLSPYIWAGTNLYKSGKYASDGKYDPALVDKQLGCAAIALILKTKGVDVSG